MNNIFILLILFQLKHFIADYPLQTEYMLGKFRDDWGFFKPLFIHCLVHWIFTYFIVFSYTHNIELSGSLAAFNAIIHFFMDRIKAGKRYMGRWKPVTTTEYINAKQVINTNQIKDGKFAINYEGEVDLQSFNIDTAKNKLRSNKLFWWSIGFDQMIHHLTDIACIYFMVR